MVGKMSPSPDVELTVSFGYHCHEGKCSPCDVPGASKFVLPEIGLGRNGGFLFSCLSGAALSANATLANTNVCNGVIGEEILPTRDSPKSFRKISSCSSFSKLELLSSSVQSSLSAFSCSPSLQSDAFGNDSFLKPMSAPSKCQGFLNAVEVQAAGGAAGEDRVQAICSEENGLLFCGIYDGFNGRDAADFLAGTFYDTIMSYLSPILGLEWKQDFVHVFDSSDAIGSLSSAFNGPGEKTELQLSQYQKEVVDGLRNALADAETEFLHMVEQEMDDRPDLVSVGSCVLAVLLHGNDLYTLNLGDSRVVLATYGQFGGNNRKELKAVELTENHNVDNEVEKDRLLSDHPDDPKTIVMGKVKGKLKVTRALGVGYLKKEVLNDALMGILRVRNLKSPPYISTQPAISVHSISQDDHFIVVASDGLFDFFTNDEVVKLIHSFILENPASDPAKLIVEQLLLRAADCASLALEELMNIPAGKRRKYHDDVTVVVIILGSNQRTLKASTCI
ncbi:hypothetical protein MLD38_017990 [Melastoma candidum]|uniref:Uncharacterized protein n=1 Tax=Melastoma candidum TaxID=119954 RepID=A0ACB9QSF7_9MYRT|nr:hypothetical protein MLD38_017990 [Melastoma candidum]